MRGLTKGGIALFIISFFISLFHSCTLDNGILKPSCLVFEIDLNEKWWHPHDNASKAIYFRSNGMVVMDGVTDTITFTLENCNKLYIANQRALTEEIWVIKRITDQELQLQFPNDKLVLYQRKQ